jgi:hypothetical protein
MDYASFRSVLAMLSVLGMFVAIVTNIWRFGNIDLTGRWANMRGIYGRAIVVGVVLAALLRALVLRRSYSSDLHPALLTVPVSVTATCRFDSVERNLCKYR